MNAVLKYASLVKFAHTVFAMPFAMVGFVYGLRYAPLHNPRWPYIVLVQVILCMVFARNAAMGFNRWADRRIDAENPRTAGREIPAGKIPARHALWFVAVNALLFVATAATINRLAAILSPVALSVILVYSYCKRFTSCWGFRSASPPSGLLSPWPGTSSSTGTSSSNRSSSPCW